MTVRVKLNRRAARDLLKAPGVIAELERRGRNIRDAAGAENHETETWVGRNRARVTVRTKNFRGRYAEAKYRKLSRSLDAGRD